MVSSDPQSRALRPRSTPGVRLAELTALLGSSLRNPAPAQSDPVVSGVTLDSRLVQSGDLYVALEGRAHHGAEFAPAAVRAGAVAVLTDGDGQRLTAGLAQPVLAVDDPRRAMAPVAARIYGQPATTMTMLAVTGTNGKTTTSYLLDAALRAIGRHTGVVGTIGYLLDGRPLDAARTTVTTPEAPELQALLAVLVEGGAECCVMEVSSHALALNRVDAIAFDVAAFTNFGRDHLDFHGDVESYFEAKASLFTADRARSAVINVDDPRGGVLVERLQRSAVRTVTLSLTDPAADYSVSEMELGADGLTAVRLRTPDQQVEFRVGLPGDHNVRNAVTALAMLDVGEPRLPAGDLERAASGLATARVPGRMERVDLGPEGPSVFVDFAHTPQAVTAALAAVAGRRRIAVLGCGGDRDRDKRAPMGAAAAGEAEIVLVTDDNPRSEDAATIRRTVLEGARRALRESGSATEVLDGADRRSAIRRALELARPTDVLVVLGKGHEVGQEVAGTVLPFRDVDVVVDEWAALTGARAGR